MVAAPPTNITIATKIDDELREKLQKLSVITLDAFKDLMIDSSLVSENLQKQLSKADELLGLYPEFNDQILLKSVKIRLQQLLKESKGQGGDKKQQDGLTPEEKEKLELYRRYRAEVAYGPNVTNLAMTNDYEERRQWLDKVAQKRGLSQDERIMINQAMQSLKESFKKALDFYQERARVKGPIKAMTYKTARRTLGIPKDQSLDSQKLMDYYNTSKGILKKDVSYTPSVKKDLEQDIETAYNAILKQQTRRGSL
jgi:hypothetical protein